MANQLLSFSRFGALGGWLLGWTDFLQVAFHCHFQVHALGAATLDVDASDHFVLVRRAQSSGSRFVRKVLVLVGQPVLRTRAFQVPAAVLTRVAMIFLLQRHADVPTLY